MIEDLVYIKENDCKDTKCGLLSIQIDPYVLIHGLWPADEKFKKGYKVNSKKDTAIDLTNLHKNFKILSECKNEWRTKFIDKDKINQLMFVDETLRHQYENHGVFSNQEPEEYFINICKLSKPIIDLTDEAIDYLVNNCRDNEIILSEDKLSKDIKTSFLHIIFKESVFKNFYKGLVENNYEKEGDVVEAQFTVCQKENEDWKFCFSNYETKTPINFSKYETKKPNKTDSGKRRLILVRKKKF